jgi:hypothetical protein
MKYSTIKLEEPSDQEEHMPISRLVEKRLVPPTPPEDLEVWIPRVATAAAAAQVRRLKWCAVVAASTVDFPIYP